jgi:4-amino-4-deoxy-L-arabinose transferase-like glycosyltransferase
MSDNLLRALFAVTLLISIADQIPLHNTRWVEDESWYSDAGKTLMTEGRLRLSSFPPSDTFHYVDTRPPAMSAALAVSFKLFGVGIWQARLPSYIARTGTILIVFLLGIRYAGLLAGFLAAALLLSDNYLFVAGRTVRPEALVTLFTVLTLWLYHQARERKSLPLTFAASLAAAGAMAFHVEGVSAVLSLGLLLLLELRFSVWKSARAWCFALTIAAVLGSFTLWIRSDEAHLAAYRALYADRAGVPYSQKLHQEVERYKDFIGLGNQRTPLPVKIPVRAHIAIAILASLVILWRFDRTATFDLVIFMVVQVLWLSYMTNKTARYFAISTPFFALAVALAGVYLIRKTNWPRTAAWALALIFASQVAGNALILYTFRNADYAMVTEQLRAAIPPDRSVWGITTFWLALNDHRYYSYDRAPIDYAISALKPDYLILNDRVMLHGIGYGVDDFKDERERSNAFAQRSATLVAKAPDPFYGPLEIYHVCYGSAGVQDCSEAKPK